MRIQGYADVWGARIFVQNIVDIYITLFAWMTTA